MRRIVPICLCLLAAACTSGDGGGHGNSDDAIVIAEDLGPDAVTEFGGSSRAFTVAGTSTSGLNVIRDLAFHPTRDELWTINRETDSTVTFFQPGTVSQTAFQYADPGALHFMEEVSSIAFGQAGTFATCHESRNTYNDTTPPDNYMGPVLWPDDMSIYTNPTGPENSSHLDMLHESPLCMGIAWESGNVYWVFDGYHGNLVRYDFATDHGPGNNDHSDGIVRRFPEVELLRVPDVIGDMAFDPSTGLLYIADTGTGRILWVDTTTGHEEKNLNGLEDLAEYTEWQGVDFGVVAKELNEPSGLFLDGDRLLFTEHGRSSIGVIDLSAKEALGRLETPAQSLNGLTLGPDGKIWYTDATANQLVRIDP